MFGHQDNDQTNQTDHNEPQADATLDTAAAPTTNPDTPAVESNEVDEALKALAAHATPDEEPVTDPTPAPSPAEDTTLDEPTPPADEPAARDDVPAPVIGEAETSQLLDLKQSALEQLTPLFDKLEQSPEERFRTSMMMIQAADNQALLPTAYEAAQQIEDEKVKAQALLDVVNEINYFTQQNSSSEA